MLKTKAVSTFSAALLATLILLPATGCAEKKQDSAKKKIKSPAAPVMPKAPKKYTEAELWAFMPKVVAKYGKKEVTKEEFIKDFNERMKLAPMPPQLTPEMLEKVAPQMVEGMVDRMMILDVAKAAGFSDSKAAVRAIVQKNLEKLPAQRQAQMKKMLEMQKKTMDSYLDEMASNGFMRQNIAVGEWIEKNIVPTVKITDADAKAYYEKNKQQFMRPGDAPGSMRASHILITPKDKKSESDAAAKAEAEKILAQLKKGASFEKLAAEKSACPSGKRQGGSLGAFGPGRMVPEFEAATKKLKPGELSGVVKTQFGYHVIRRDKAQAGKQATFDEVKKYILGDLKKSAITKKVEAAIKKLRAKNKVEILVKGSAPVTAAKKAAAPVKKTVAPVAKKK